MNSAIKTGTIKPVNFVFVDYENVHEVEPSLIGHKSVYLTLLIGANQSKMSTALVERLMEHAASVHLVRLNFSGKNALDFALAFYLGKAANANPAAKFHIVSKDTGFEPLIKHLRSLHIQIHRHDDYTSLPFLGVSAPPVTVPKDGMDSVVAWLQKHTNNRPKRKKTLASLLATICKKDAPEADIEELIKRLCEAGKISIGDKEAVTYHLDPE